MPSYIQGSTTDITPGQTHYLFNAESPGAGQASISISPVVTAGNATVVTFQIQWNSAPTATLVIQGSNVDTAAFYQTLYTNTNRQQDNFTDTVAWAFYRALVVSESAGEPLSVIAHVS